MRALNASSRAPEASAARWLLVLSLLLSHAPASVFAAPPAPLRASAAPSSRPGASVAARMPLSFVPNSGQLASEVKFQARGAEGSFFFQAGGVVISLPLPGGRRGATGQGGARSGAAVANLRLRFLGAREEAEIAGANPLPGKFNYFIGGRPERWRTNLPTFGAVAYRQIYPGVDLKYEGAEGKLKSTYTVAPGVAPSSIRWRYEGSARVRVDDKSGDLLVGLRGATPAAELVERAPVAWQDLKGGRVFVPVRYVVGADETVSFAVGDYDARAALVIDPTFEYSRYVGGAGHDYGYGVAVDAQKNVYLTGVTASVNFPLSSAPSAPAQPTLGGKTDAFITKLDATGNTVLFSTFIGGEDDDWGFSVGVDKAGSAHVTGYTRSADFPTSRALQPSFGGGPADAFAVKLSPDGGSLTYSTYIGGGDEEAGYGAALGGDGSLYLTGYTRSTDFPLARALQPSSGGREDAFLLRLRQDGSALLFGTYIGGGGRDAGQGVAVDAYGHAHVVGYTHSNDFPTAAPFQKASGGHEDAFVTKVAPDGGALLFSTYLGGSDSDYGRAIALDDDGSMYVTGSTRSSDFPTVKPAQGTSGGGDDAFVAKIRSLGTKLQYSTYLGGAGLDHGLGIAVSREGSAYVTGRTSSNNFPTASALQAASGGGDDAFVTRLNGAGDALLFSTYLGGRLQDFGEAVALDGSGDAYVAGYTKSTDFPGAPPNPLRAARETVGDATGLVEADGEAFVAKIRGLLPTP